MLITRGDDEIFRRLVLENQPHTFYIVFGIAPIAERRQVAQIQFILLSLSDAGGGEGDLAGHERLAATLRLVVEQDPRAAKHVVGFAILLDDPVAVEFRHGIRRVRMERGVFILRYFLDFPVKFRGRGLINATCIGKTALTHGFQNAQYARGVDIGCKLRSIERHLNMALGCKVIDFIRTDLANDLQQTHRVAEVCIMEMEMRLTLQVGNPLPKIYGGTTYGTMHVIAFLQ